MYLVFLGAPGAGKGTQAADVAHKLNMVHISSGDLFRDALGKGTELGKKAKSYMERGELVPDEVTTQMVLERLAAPGCARGVILDGFPRNLAQAQALDKALKREKKAVDKVILLEVSDEELIKRLSGRRICRNCQAVYHIMNSPPKVAGKCDKCGGELYQRPDDNVETIKNRLEVYSVQTAPLIDYYRKPGKLAEVRGEGGVDLVSERIIEVLQGSR
ncbi:MAG: adenylate kinase [Chloroflexota bacterium]